MDNTRTVIAGICFLLIATFTPPAFAISEELWYGERVSYLVEALVRKPPKNCDPPFRPWGIRNLTLTIWVRNDTTQEVMSLDKIPLFGPGRSTLELTQPVVVGAINLHHRRVTLRLPPFLAFFVGNHEYFIAAQGTVNDRLDLVITLERITTDPHKRFCPMAYHVTGYQLQERNES